MNISSVSSNQSVYMPHTRKTRSEYASLEFGTGLTASAQTPLEYYQKLCEEFPNITFRLDDKASYPSEGSVFLGYNNSMNQIGDNFGEMGQCSIVLDVEVIRRMQRDPAYEQRVKGIIDTIEDNYGTYEQQAKRDGWEHMCAFIEDDNGEIKRGKIQSHMRFSTEEEVREMWKDEFSYNRILINMEEIRDTLLDEYLKMLENREEKLERLGIYHITND